MCSPGGIAQALGIADTINIPSMNNRGHNFDKFVKQHFLFETNMMEEMFIYSWLDPGYTFTKAYETLWVYSRTPYGAMMIQKILFDHQIKGRVPFKVRRYNDRAAAGSTDYIQFPEGFSLKKKLDSGEIVDPLAIIHHEFGHTRYFSGHKRGVLVTPQDERLAVINMENPARMYNKNEPRYAYFNGVDKVEEQYTINIITGVVKAGIWAVDETDPRILVKPK